MPDWVGALQHLILVPTRGHTTQRSQRFRRLESLSPLIGNPATHNVTVLTDLSLCVTVRAQLQSHCPKNELSDVRASSSRIVGAHRGTPYKGHFFRQFSTRSPVVGSRARPIYGESICLGFFDLFPHCTMSRGSPTDETISRVRG